MRGWGWMVFWGIVALVPVGAGPIGLELSQVFTDRAVLQRDRPVPIWGTAAPGVTVTLSFGDQKLTTVSDLRGRWRVDLAPQPASAEGRELVVQSSDGQEQTREDVLVGDLWYCAGQSNMELGMSSIRDRAQEVKDLKYPALRLYLIPKTASGKVRDDVYGAWVPSDRLSITSGGWNGFSAVAYTFGRKLQRELGVPVGILQAAYGGSPISAWIRPQELAADRSFKRYVAQTSAADQEYSDALAQDPEATHPFDDPSDTRDLGPSSIWHAMVEPLGPLALRGVTWYQGETDVGDGPLYAKKMNALIAGWREAWGRPDLPFYFVQIAPWEGYGGDSLPRLWLAQEAVLTTPGTGMVLTVDVGDFANIHPTNKRPVGERLALQALAKTYGRTDVVADGPVFTQWKATSAGAVVSWKTSAGLTTSDQRAPLGFEVLDAEGEWSMAPAALGTGDEVVVLSSIAVQGVRYAWSSTPLGNLCDTTGLPARPFSSQP